MSLPKYQFGYTTFITELDSAIEYAAKHGLTNLEVNFSKEVTPIDAGKNVDVIQLGEKAEQNGITLSFHIPFTENISDIIAPIRNRSIHTVNHYLDIAGMMKAKLMTIHPGIFYWFPVEKVMRDKSLKRFIKGINCVLPKAEQVGVKLALENLVPIPQGSEFFFLGDNISDFEFIFENIESEYLGFCLDTGHANMAEGGHHYVEALGERLINVHFHDNLGKNDNHLAIGKGNVQWEELCLALSKINFTGPFISECRDVEPQIAAKIFMDYLDTK